MHQLRMACQPTVDLGTCIYCVQLPFKCQSVNPVTQRALPELQRLLLFPEYCVVKVGISNEPARRLHDIMSGFQGLGDSGQWFTDGLKTSNHDCAGNTFYKGKSEDKIVFIQKCRDLRDAEDQIRQRIGKKLDSTFQEQFRQSVDPDKRSYTDRVGITEWVLMRTDLMKYIQQDYRSTWTTAACPEDPILQMTHIQSHRSLDPTGCEFTSEIFVRCYQHELNCGLALHGGMVKIKFLPTRFEFTLDCMKSTNWQPICATVN